MSFSPFSFHFPAFLLCLPLFTNAGLFHNCKSGEDCPSGCCRYGYCLQDSACSRSFTTCSSSTECKEDECCHLGYCMDEDICTEILSNSTCNDYSQCPIGQCIFGYCPKFLYPTDFFAPFYFCLSSTDCPSQCCFANICMESTTCTWASSSQFAEDVSTQFIEAPDFLDAHYALYSPFDCPYLVESETEESLDFSYCSQSEEYATPDSWIPCKKDSDCLFCCKETGFCSSFEICTRIEGSSVKKILLSTLIPFGCFLIVVVLVMWRCLRNQKATHHKSKLYEARLKKERQEAGLKALDQETPEARPEVNENEEKKKEETEFEF